MTDNLSASAAPASAAPPSAPAGAPAPSSAPASSPAGAGSPAQGGGPAPEDISKIFGYDPFAEPAPQPTPAPTPAPSATPQATPAPAPVAAPPGSPGAPGLDQISQQLEQLTTAVAQGQAGQPQQPPVDPIEQVDVPAYSLNVPDALAAALQSQNPAEFRQGMNTLVKGVLQHAHQNIVVAMRREIAQHLPAIIGAQVQQITQQQRVFQDFYGKFPALSAPAFRPLVTQVGMQVAREMKIDGWNDQLRDAIGARVMQMLQGVVPQAAPAPAPQAQPAAPVLMPTGASPGADPSLSGFAKEFASII